MLSTHPELWQAILAFHPDHPTAILPFSKRLALEQGWTRRYAVRAIEEYKKFIFLVCTAGHPVTPSEHVDEVWHLHLIYTRSYWDEFCGQVLKRPVHHNPTEGGPSEDARYHEQYQKTLETYAKVFGMAPPEDIWPPVAERFRRGIRQHSYPMNWFQAFKNRFLR